MPNIYPDVSEHQVTINDAFNRKFVMFRDTSEWDRPDADQPVNQRWAMAARTSGKIVNFGVYVIPGFVSNAELLARLDVTAVPRDCVVMIDWETWSGQLSGDHSASNNDLASRLRARQGGRADLVWGYSNRGDLSAWSSRPSWLGFIIAGYNGNDPRDEGIGNVVGWQYSNGVENHTSWPSSTPPFGACDHNALFIDYPTPSEDDMFSDDDRALLNRVGQLLHTNTDGLAAAIAAVPEQSAVRTSQYMAGTIQRVIDIQTKVGALNTASQPVDVASLAGDLATALGPELGKQLVSALATKLGSAA